MFIASTSSGILPAAWAASVWKKAFLLAADLADLGERLDDADLVVHRHDRDHHGFGR